MSKNKRERNNDGKLNRNRETSENLNMEDNFTEKVNEIRKMLNLWFLRHLTPYGKITVIKTLAISKLSHIALVIPTLNKTMIKDIEKI